jgi:hypothetical protein
MHRKKSYLKINTRQKHVIIKKASNKGEHCVMTIQNKNILFNTVKNDYTRMITKSYEI